MPEESTVRLSHRLEDGLGKDMATLLVEHFATKQDITELRETLVTKVEFAEFKADIKAGLANLESRFNRDLRTTALVLVGTNIALIGGAAALVGFA